jgi:hypothetical protein
MGFATEPVAAAEEQEQTPKEVLTEELPPGEEVAGEAFMDRMVLIADFDLFFSTSDLSGSGGSLSGSSLNGLLAPAYMVDDTTFLILMYDGHYYKRREMFSDDVGARQRDEFQQHTIEPMLRKDFGERSRYSITPSVFWTWTYNKDVDTSGWDDGLYNYRDVGAGLDFDMRYFDMRYAFGEDGKLSLGAEYYEREYPNFASLISITGLDTAAGVATERWEKDYTGYIGRAGYSWVKPLGFSWETEYSLLYKDLDDKKVVNSNGVMTSEEEEAYVHSLDLNFWHTLDIDGGLRLGLDLNGTIYDSNQNFWDERIQGLFSPQKYTSDYYDSFSYRISPNISYTFALLPLTPSISYTYQRTDYSDRQAKYFNGDYSSSDMYEETQEIKGSLRYDFTDNWSVKGQWQTIVSRSNEQDERVYRYDYQIDIFAIGVMYKY